MPTYLMKHTGSGTAPYDTWAKALPSLAAAAAAMAAGDTIKVSSTHSEAPASLSVTIPGTVGNPSRIVCVTESGASGDTGAATGALIDVTGTTFSVSGNFVCHGITFRSSAVSTGIPAFAASNGNAQVFNSCRFELTGANANAAVKFGSFTAAGGSIATVINSVFKFSHVNQRIQSDYNLRIAGGSLDGSGTAVSGIFSTGVSTRGGTVLVRDFDVSAGMTAAGNLVTAIGGGAVFTRLTRIKVPASWTGGPVTSGQLKAGDRVELIKASSGATIYEAWIEDFAGTIRDESVIKVTAQTRSYRMASNANCGIVNPLRGIPSMIPVGTSAQTLTLDVATDNVTLTDAEMYLEADYLNTAGSGLGVLLTDDAASYVATPAAQTTSTTPWTTTGLTTPIRQALAVTLTAGYSSDAVGVPVLNKASSTVYVAEETAVA